MSNRTKQPKLFGFLGHRHESSLYSRNSLGFSKRKCFHGFRSKRRRFPRNKETCRTQPDGRRQNRAWDAAVISRRRRRKTEKEEGRRKVPEIFEQTPPDLQSNKAQKLQQRSEAPSSLSVSPSLSSRRRLFLSLCLFLSVYKYIYKIRFF